MDEQELSKLFRDAARHAPPASFDHDDVLDASRRATARRRNTLAGGSMLVVAVLSGGAVVGGQVLQQAQPQAAPPPAAASPTTEPGGRALSPQPLSTMGAAPDRRVGCGSTDPGLAAALTDAVADRSAAPAGATVPLTQPCPPGARAAGVRLPGGTVYVVLSPATAGLDEGGATRADGGRSYTVAAHSGATVSVLSVPAGPSQPAPLGDEVDELARDIAAHH